MIKLILTAGLISTGFALSAQSHFKAKPGNQEKMLVWKPTKKVSYNWNDGANQFDFSDTTYYTYETNQLTPKIQRRSVNGQDVSITNYIWDANGNTLLTEYIMFNGFTMDTAYRDVYTYDNFNNKLTHKHYTNNSGTLVLTDNNNRIFVNTLNAQNKPTQTIIQTYNSSNSQFEDYGRRTYIYHTSGKILQYTEEGWDGTEWMKYIQEDVVFDANNNITGFSDKQDDGTNNWIEYSRYTDISLKFPGADLFDIEYLGYIFEEYNTSTSQFELNERFNTVVSGNETFKNYELYENNNWVMDEVKYIQTDNYGNVLKELYSNGHLSDTSTYMVHSYTLDSDNHPMEEIKTDSLNPLIKYKYIYSDYILLNIQVASIVDKGTQYFDVYPNPSNGVFTIKDLEIETLKVIDCSGQVILNTKSNTIDLSNVNAGMYILQITDKNGYTNAQRIVKQ